MAVILASVVLCSFLHLKIEIGVPKSELKEEIRSTHKINDDWIAEGTSSDMLAAYIFFPEDMSDHIFCVYLNHPGFSFGYFLRAGGNLGGVQGNILEFTIEGYSERVFISMNKQKVEKLKIDDDNSVQTIGIDSNKPFSIILPTNAGDITFLDINGDEIDFRNQPI